MSNKKHGLGRGINSLLGDYSYDILDDNEKKGLDRVEEIRLDRIKNNPNQPRKVFDEKALEELKESIKVQGVIQPIIVEEIGDGNFSIIAGERRFRASKLAGLTKIPAIVRAYSDIQRLEISLIENIQRENLNPLEEAKAYAFLLTHSDINHEELAQRVGKSRSTITNTVRLLSLPEKMQNSLFVGDFSSGHARALLAVVNPADREILYKKIIEEKISVRKAEEIAQELNQGKRKTVIKKKKIQKPFEIQEVEEKFISAMGTKVELKGNVNKGKIEIKYNSIEELERIYQFFSEEEELF